ncbi:uncharacterized protein FA14DRAFT_154462 [Meira miltonrushii]|uniref:Uncharacterized protein n=1 Tax=Meira miltonrushii TaxID=1280837 RepID=A0A316VFE2_9BASI|nr:uncharacterized protein FA14DRAFT_154462 [Meira miltonrushii]PWN35033.1 hypothetical protein FA14DRAFT_154462 [Meira miltonrushii]
MYITKILQFLHVHGLADDRASSSRSSKRASRRASASSTTQTSRRSSGGAVSLPTPTFSQEELDRVFWVKSENLEGRPSRRMMIDLANDDDLSIVPPMTQETRNRLVRAVQLKHDRERDKTPSTDEEFVKLSVTYQFIDNRGQVNIRNKAGDHSSVAVHHGSAAASNTEVSSIFHNGESFTSGALNTQLLFQSHKKRWEVIRFIALKNLQVFCTHKFDVSDKDHMNKWMKVLGLRFDRQENYEPCLDYLNLLSKHDNFEFTRPTVLRNSFEIVVKWEKEGGNKERIKAYLQRRLLTYYHSVYLKHCKNNGEAADLAPYLCIPEEERLRKKFELQTLQQTFTDAGFNHGLPFTCVPFKEPNSDMELDGRCFYVHSNAVLRDTNKTNLYTKNTIDTLKTVMDIEKAWREQRNRNSHHVDGKEAKSFVRMLETQEFKKAVQLRGPDAEMIRLIKSQFRHLFGSGYGSFDDSDDLLQTYILPNVIDGELTDYESVPSSSQSFPRSVPEQGKDLEKVFQDRQTSQIEQLHGFFDDFDAFEELAEHAEVLQLQKKHPESIDYIDQFFTKPPKRQIPDGLWRIIARACCKRQNENRITAGRPLSFKTSLSNLVGVFKAYKLLTGENIKDFVCKEIFGGKFTSFKTPRERITIATVISLLTFTAARPGELVVSSGYEIDNEGLRWGDVEFFLSLNLEKGQSTSTRLQYRANITIRNLKGKRKQGQYRTQSIYEDDSILIILDATILLLILAVIDNAIDCTIFGEGAVDPIQFLTSPNPKLLPPRKDYIQIEILADKADLMVFRESERDTQTREWCTNPLVGLRYYSLNNLMRSILQRSDYTVFLLYAIRRCVCTAINKPEVSSTDARLAIGHLKGSSIYEKHYVSKYSEIDFQGLVTKGIQDHASILKQGIAQEPKFLLTSQELLQIEENTELKELRQKISQMKRQILEECLSLTAVKVMMSQTYYAFE